MSKIRVAVFASGDGSNFQALLDNEDLVCEIVLLVCDNPGAKVIERAENAGIPTYVFDPNEYKSKLEYELHLLKALVNAEVRWMFLAGYMRILSPLLVEVGEDRILNIHPSLLPAFPGKDAIKQALEAGVEKTGVTVHYVDEGIDTGRIVAQEEVEILPNDTEKTLKERIQRVEHRLYPQVINDVLIEFSKYDKGI
ncbi:formyltetrahydrofolate-dependent phosphoribosylglycinamide formyltransferase [Oceanobacillus limi]|uniref:Phosphoribosylglycinamide formyltransferase n=1 Tax=Oceanobacillus limi TaxID=930131 RepID=A0A1I0E308_9BACI|nr:phosphoribosylglycinamide formyltransferase [Oceanobacillus limi]SET39484.1 formyltetrahydrofolate-dependent phosphoribosylglycinamide formyltransferase [Oceanobacillus limi]